MHPCEQTQSSRCRQGRPKAIAIVRVSRAPRPRRRYLARRKNSGRRGWRRERCCVMAIDSRSRNRCNRSGTGSRLPFTQHARVAIRGGGNFSSQGERRRGLGPGDSDNCNGTWRPPDDSAKMVCSHGCHRLFASGPASKANEILTSLVRFYARVRSGQ